MLSYFRKLIAHKFFQNLAHEQLYADICSIFCLLQTLVFPGLTFVSADGKVHLRVLETRPMLSGAMPVKGSLNQLVPGAAVRLQIRQIPVERKEFLK